MQKGFTLIELLIVMIIVGILVTVMLPKYNASLERGRSTEALTNLKAASEVLNARYIIDNNRYVCGLGANQGGIVNSSTGDFSLGGEATANFTKPNYFDAPKVVNASSTCSASNIQTISVITNRTTGDFSLTAHNEKGELKYITCTVGTGAPTSICENIGAELTANGSGGNEYRITF